MTERERVLEAVAHRDTDIVPYQLDFTQRAAEQTAEYLGDPDFMEKIGNHLAINDWGGFEEVRPNFFKDHFGVVWNRTVDKDIGVVEDYLLKEPTLAGYEFPDPHLCPLAEGLEEFVRDNEQRFRVASIGFAVFERAWTLRGMENLLMDMYLHPAFVDELIERITEYNITLIERTLEHDIDCIRFGDDWGMQQGLIFGKKLWQRFIQPAYKKMFQMVKDSGKHVMLHSCGDVKELFPDLIDMGLDIFNTFQPELMDPEFMKREYGKHLTFYGGISTQRVLPFATPDEVKRNVREMMDKVGQGGGYIVAPTHSMPGDIPPENIVAFIEVVQNQ